MTTSDDRWSSHGADPADDHGFRVPVAPVASRAGRRWRIVGLAGASVVALVVALAQGAPPPLPDRPSVADVPMPSGSRPARIAPVATALPVQEWFTGPEAPIDSVLLDGERVSWLHLASARSTGPVEGVPGRDLLLRSGSDGTVCLCLRPADPGTDGAGTLESIRVDADLVVSSRTVLRSLPAGGPASAPNRTLVAIEPARDGRAALLSWLIPSRTAWSIGLDAIDLGADIVTDSIDLSIRPPRASYFPPSVPAPTLQIAPDDRHAFVTVGAPSGAPEGYGSFRGVGWIVGFDGTRLEPATPLELADDLRLDRCSWMDFVSAEVVAAVCSDPSSDDADAVAIHRWGMDGRALPGDPLRLVGLDPGRPLIDQTHGIIYLWDAIDHRLVAIDAVRGGERSTRVEERDAPSAVIQIGDGARDPAPNDVTVRWSDGGPGIAHATRRLLIGSSDGRWLYAAGRTAAEGSTGVWVFDAASLAALERWPALTSYEDLALLDDGRWLLALGQPGVGPSGDRAPWGVSLTVLDTRSGRPIRRIADVGLGASVAFHRAGPVVAGPGQSMPR